MKATTKSYFFVVQESKRNVRGPGILYYCKKIPAIMLANQYILLGVVNRIRAIIYSVIFHREDICFFI